MGVGCVYECGVCGFSHSQTTFLSKNVFGRAKSEKYGGLAMRLGRGYIYAQSCVRHEAPTYIPEIVLGLS